MMKAILRRWPFLPMTLGALLMISLLIQPAPVSAASMQAHQSQEPDSISNQYDCSPSETNDLVIVANWSVDCFSAVSGSENVDLINVSTLETGAYYVTFTWLDYNGGSHTSTKSPWTFLSAGDAAANSFGGYGTMEEITSIGMVSRSILIPTNCVDNTDGGGVFMATNIPSTTAYWTDCFSSTGTHSVNLDGVYAIETGLYTLSFSWTDYNGGHHTSTLAPRTLLAAGDANGGSGKFVGSDYIDQITSITLTA